MKTLKVESHIGKDGILRLQLPPDFYGSDVVVLVEPLSPHGHPDDNCPPWSDFINKYAGCLSESPIDRGDQGEYEFREQLA